MFIFWQWRSFRLRIGIDPAIWGLGFVLNFAYPRGFAAQFGPVFVKMEKS